MSQADFDFCQSYLRILRHQYAGLNLTRIQDSALFYIEQFQDSIAPLEQGLRFKKSLEEKKLLVDVGFGGGFPILPLAHRCPWATFVGFEGRGKKVQAVKDIAGQLGLRNGFFYHHRIEEVEVDLPCLITFRAVGEIAPILEKVVLSEKCELYFYKGPGLEKKEGLQWGTGEQWRLIEDVSFKVGHLSRRLLGLENVAVPRGTVRKDLVKLSSLL